MALGAADSERSRAAVFRTLGDDLLSRGEIGNAIEVLSPVRHDPCSLVPFAVTIPRLLARPNSVVLIASNAVDDYAISPEAMAMVRTQASAS